jgi:1-acyl-sn-glycerol-3-phosphate acyltransferase
MTEARAGSPLWAAYEFLAMVLGLGALALMCLAWLPFAMLLHPVLPRRIGQPLGRFVARCGFNAYLGILALFCSCRFDLEELEQLRDEGPLILAANHPSLLDAVLVLSCLPNTVCVMKAALMDNILFGAAARLARFIRNDSPLAMIVDAGEELERGALLLIFPEGTRTSRFPVNPCLPSAGLIARRSKVAVQTLLIEFSTPYLGKHWPLFRRPELPLLCRIRLGRRFAPPENVETFTAELESCFRAELSQEQAASVASATLPDAPNARSS